MNYFLCFDEEYLTAIHFIFIDNFYFRNIYLFNSSSLLQEFLPEVLLVIFIVYGLLVLFDDIDYSIRQYWRGLGCLQIIILCLVYKFFFATFKSKILLDFT